MNYKEVELVLEAERATVALMPTFDATDKDEDEEIRQSIIKAFVLGANYAKNNP